ncbi:TlpA disulfide reductase family protein [Comamonas flocculans]|uniref:TlpA family protein disulfide reductase n=1 Tax=Comamonas flocculans TaxID=2597701 RepID=A0A5B8RZP0_9BURK|nr:TlpA disulfide reductase family protein [Comamonas flocculans]QEA14308.1 TlpA family protein disulfide reductase [Comamonas flocculans]
MSTAEQRLFPDWEVSRWFNADAPVSLTDLRGQVVLVEAFQMLCPGCVSQALPLARKVHQMYGGQGLAVIGLHTVFEHHDAMQPHALEAFLYEYKIRFPVGVDQPLEHSPLPATMLRWQLQGTPSTLLIDRAGRLRAHHFGSIDELELGVVLGRLLAEDGIAAQPPGPVVHSADEGACTPAACPAPSTGR